MGMVFEIRERKANTGNEVNSGHSLMNTTSRNGQPIYSIYTRQTSFLRGLSSLQSILHVEENIASVSMSTGTQESVATLA